jgi:DNA-binding response OmpR family regulator
MAENPKILIAEDDDNLRETLAQHLSDGGFEVVTAANGNDAIPLLYGKEFHLVVLDLKMPYIDGFQVLKVVKSTFPKTKVIILTAYADLTNITKCKELGADEVIGKPYNLSHLFAVIEGLMKQ